MAIHITAEDTEDLTIISAHLQDALVRYGDICYLKKNHLFALLANRFTWEEETPRRRRTGLHIENVLKVQHQRLDKAHDDLILSLLAISFTPGDDLAGTLTLNFSAGFTIKLEVECLSLTMKDLGLEWHTEKTPCHNL